MKSSFLFFITVLQDCRRNEKTWRFAGVVPTG